MSIQAAAAGLYKYASAPVRPPPRPRAPGVRRERIGRAVLYLAKCQDVIDELSADAVVTDPPYGIGADRFMEKKASETRHAGGFHISTTRSYIATGWDDHPVDSRLMAAVVALAPVAIVFGGNHYALPPSRGWLVWDKLNSGAWSDCELAWTNLDRPVRRIRYLWNGACRANRETRGDHPTQKPIGVMAWAIRQLPAGVRHVVDPFMGSGTTGVAAVQMGFRFTGVEAEANYFDAACRRIEEAQAQPSLLEDGAASPATQGDLFGGDDQ